MKIKSTTILTKFRSLFDAMFFQENFIYKYLVLYDRLLKDEKLVIKSYKETDDIVVLLSEDIENLSDISNKIFDLPCDLMFDLYSRYCVLLEFLTQNETINVSSYTSQKLFIELLNEIWRLGIPTFTRKLV